MTSYFFLCANDSIKPTCTDHIPVDVSVDDHQMETVGDKYMLVSGLPEKNSEHAHNIALAAVDMLRTARDIRVGSHPVQVGHHVTCCVQHVTSVSACIHVQVGHHVTCCAQHVTSASARNICWCDVT